MIFGEIQKLRYDFIKYYNTRNLEFIKRHYEVRDRDNAIQHWQITESIRTINQILDNRKAKQK